MNSSEFFKHVSLSLLPNMLFVDFAVSVIVVYVFFHSLLFNGKFFQVVY